MLVAVQLEEILYQAHHTTDAGTKIMVALVIVIALLVIALFAYMVTKSERENSGKNDR